MEIIDLLKDVRKILRTEEITVASPIEVKIVDKDDIYPF